MLDIGFSELLLILVAAIIFIRPKDLPVVLRSMARLIRDIRGFFVNIKAQARQLAKESGVDDLTHDMTSTILDLEGKPQQAYDVQSLQALKSSRDTRDA